MDQVVGLEFPKIVSLLLGWTTQNLCVREPSIFNKTPVLSPSDISPNSESIFSMCQRPSLVSFPFLSHLNNSLDQRQLGICSLPSVSPSIISPDSESFLSMCESTSSICSPPSLSPRIFPEPDSILCIDATNECFLSEALKCGHAGQVLAVEDRILCQSAGCASSENPAQDAGSTQALESSTASTTAPGAMERGVIRRKPFEKNITCVLFSMYLVVSLTQPTCSGKKKTCEN